VYRAKDTSTLQSVLTVSELTAQIRTVLEDVFDRVAVVGEISNAKVYPSGHWYFSLKDKDATIPCVCFKNANQQLKFELEDGLMVVARGKLSVYPPRGAYQLVVTSLEPVGIGDWQLAFDQLRAKLDREGLLDPARKRPIPLLPRRVGVVTSVAGAALHDIISALRRRNRNVNIVISPAKVQGEGSSEEIAQAIKNLEELGGVDVMIVGRGGGSIEDLWSFNTEVVARAVAGCSVPIISGVGHETDVTICDLVADLRAPTPTAAAELVARGHSELAERWSYSGRRLDSRIRQLLSDASRAVDRLNPTASLLRYQERLKRFSLNLSNLSERSLRSLTTLLTRLQHKWQHNHARLLALGPQNVLNRGFSVLRKEDGTVVRSSADVKPGEVLEALLENGKLKVRVDSIEDHWYKQGEEADL
jgi:exodeoxyribonuclease VII large subunit